MNYLTETEVGNGSVYTIKDPEVNGSGTAKIAIDPTVAQIAGFDEGALWYETPPNALKFSSDSAFTMSVYSPPYWDGIVEYSTDGKTWTVWDGSELSGDGTHPIYLRGTGNTRISSNGTAMNPPRFSGKYCTGNLECLLDYQAVANGQHPSMNSKCFHSMFSYSSNLEVAPDLLSPVLAEECYAFMFYYCEKMVYPPKIAATTMARACCQFMFSRCSKLLFPPELPAMNLAQGCYADMFAECVEMIALPKLPATTLPAQCYYDMFSNCKKIRVSSTSTSYYKYPFRMPNSGTGVETGTNTFTYMLMGTGGTFTSDPTVNTTYYTDYEPV